MQRASTKTDFAKLLQEELAKVPNGTHQLVLRLEELCRKIDEIAVSSIPVEISEDEDDSLVVSISDALGSKPNPNKE